MLISQGLSASVATQKPTRFGNAGVIAAMIASQSMMHSAARLRREWEREDRLDKFERKDFGDGVTGERVRETSRKIGEDRGWKAYSDARKRYEQELAAYERQREENRKLPLFQRIRAWWNLEKPVEPAYWIYSDWSAPESDVLKSFKPEEEKAVGKALKALKDIEDDW